MTTTGLRARPALSARRLLLPTAETGSPALVGFLSQYMAAAEAALAIPFSGLTTDGTPLAGLFALGSTGVSTQPIVDAANAFLACLSPAQHVEACFGISDEAWRQWSNIHPFVMRHGVLLDELSPAQRARGLELVRTTCSTRGFEAARNVMKLNEAIGEISGRWEEYGEWLYWLSIFGRPSPTEPWGWQIDGHHLIINCFVLGDQLVMSPTFLGSEPVFVDDGKYAGTRVFEAEEQQGLEFVRGLTRAEQEQAILFRSTLGRELPAGRAHPQEGRIQGTAFHDSLRLAYEGLPVGELGKGAQTRLLDLINIYVGRMRPGHDRVKMDEVCRHLAQTYFVWFGGVEDDSVFYYRIHSPVLFIEFDHLSGIAFDNDDPSRNHIHTVMRTPNGNDYGKDLLRQHYERHHWRASRS